MSSSSSEMPIAEPKHTVVKSELTPAELSRKYFQDVQAKSPIPLTNHLCAEIQSKLNSLKDIARKNNDSKLFEFVRIYFTSFDSLVSQIKNYKKRANLIVDSFFKNQLINFRHDHLDIIENLKVLHGELIVISVEVNEKVENTKVKESTVNANFPNPSGSSSTSVPAGSPSAGAAPASGVPPKSITPEITAPDLSSSLSVTAQFFAPSPEERKSHEEFRLNFLDKLSSFNAYVIPARANKIDFHIVKKMQIYATLFEVQAFLSKQHKSHAQLLCSLGPEKIRRLHLGLINARDLVEDVMCADDIRFDKMYKQVMEFTKTFEQGVRTNNFLTLRDSAFYKISVNHVAKIEKGRQTRSSTEALHYKTCFTYEKLFFSSLKMDLPEGFRESAIALLGMHHQIYGRTKVQYAPAVVKLSK